MVSKAYVEIEDFESFSIRQAKQRYEGIKYYHPKIIKELDILFDTKLPLQRPHFSRESEYDEGIVYYAPRDRYSAFMVYPLEDDVFELSQEEVHRYHLHINPFVRRSSNGILKKLIREAVVFYACVKVLPKLGFNKISKIIERWAHDARINAHMNSVWGEVVLGLDEVVKLLLERDEDFFREFARSRPEGLLGKLRPEWEAVKELDVWHIPSFSKYIDA